MSIIYMLMNLNIGIKTRSVIIARCGKLPKNVNIMLMSSVVQYKGNVIVMSKNVAIDRCVSRIILEYGIGVAIFQKTPVANGITVE